MRVCSFLSVFSLVCEFVGASVYSSVNVSACVLVCIKIVRRQEKINKENRTL